MAGKAGGDSGTREAGVGAETAELLRAGDVKPLEALGAPALAKALLFEHRTGLLLANRAAAAETELADADLAPHEAVLTPETREFWRDQLLENRAQARVALAALGKGGAPAGASAGASGAPAGTAAVGEKKPMHNRATARPVVPAGVGAVAVGGADDGADAKARAIRNRAHALAAAEKIPFATAWDRVAKEKT